MNLTKQHAIKLKETYLNDLQKLKGNMQGFSPLKNKEKNEILQKRILLIDNLTQLFLGKIENTEISSIDELKKIIDAYAPSGRIRDNLLTLPNALEQVELGARVAFSAASVANNTLHIKLLEASLESSLEEEFDSTFYLNCIAGFAAVAGGILLATLLVMTPPVGVAAIVGSIALIGIGVATFSYGLFSKNTPSKENVELFGELDQTTPRI